MRRYGLYDATRGLTTALAAGVAGLLLWVATLVGTQSVGRFWAAMGIVAGAGLIVAVAQAVGGWTKGLRLRPSPGTFLFAFVPVLVCVGWILMASQPGRGWEEGTVTSWTHSLGLTGLVHDLSLWHGVLAFGFGLVLGLALDTVPAPVPELAAAEPLDGAAAPPVADEPVAAERGEVGGARRPVDGRHPVGP
ncbi:MAG: hypothetical protein KGI93_09855, partial [Acidobacteriota bacterium]|nr:hypothetical protein [Acidobacteriota bacterium]